MKKNLLLVLALVLLVSASFANSFKVAEMDNTQNSRDSRFEHISWIDDFEGEDNWTTVDETSAPQAWHIHTEGGTQGDVWWMGGDNGGYYNGQYLVLDTPAIPVTAGNSTLTFDINFYFEALGAHEGYNGWDGGNIRISTNQETWTVISGTPAYNATSMYSFGDIHGEGPNVPGWGGSSNGWQSASYDLSAYQGQDVYVRFAFASDLAYCTDDEPALFGMKIDNIALASFTNDGTAGNMVASSMIPLGGDNWNLAEVPNAFSGSHVYQLQNDEGTYNPNLLNSLISPIITLPGEGEIIATFEAMGEFSDPDSGGQVSDVDYFGFQVKLEGTNQWYTMSNPYGSDSGSNYIYDIIPEVWMPVHEYFVGLDGRIDDYAGEDVRFKIFFRSDDDDPIGTGMMVDDFRIINEVFLAEVNNLEAEVNNNEVDLTWESPLQMETSYFPTAEQLAGYTFNTILSAGEVSGTYAIKVQNNDNYDKPISQVSFAMAHLGSQPYTPIAGTADLYYFASTNGQPSAQGQLIAENVSGISVMNFFTYDIGNTNFVIPANGEAYIAVADFAVQNTVGESQGILAETDTPSTHSYFFDGSSWQLLNDAFTGTIGEVAIQVTYLEDDPTLPSADSYKVYHSENGSSYTFLGETINTDYNHASPVLGALNYYKVTAIFGVNESQGVTTTAFLLPGGLTEITNDDGSAEQAYTASISNIIGTKFVHTHQATLKYIKFYIETLNSGNMLYRVYTAANGMPVESLGTTVVTNGDLVQGWNTIELPNPILFESGKFFIAFLNVNNSSLLGLDTSSNGNLYLSTDQGTSWNPQTTGNLLVRAIVENGPVDNYDEDIAPVVSNIGNYPNPFNPETTISFNMSKAGNASVAIYNLRGQLVNTLVNGEVAAGNQSVVWNGNDANNKSVASGVYFFRVKTDNQTISKKMVLQK